MKVFILGSGGMAGHVVALRLAELGHDVTGFARKALPFCRTVTGDALTADWPALIKTHDAVINCLGILNKAVDAEPHKGIWLNAYLPHLLAAHAKRVIHLSTDCVFSGHDGGGYGEDSFCSADTLYGRSKALGELKYDRHLTFRTSIVGPDINENGIGLFHWFIRRRETVNGYEAAYWSGVTTITLANAIHVALGQGLSGVYHLTNGEKISKRELLMLFNKLRDEPVGILPVNEMNEDKSLVCNRTDFNFVVPPYVEMVREMGEWITKHKAMYPLYPGGGQANG